MGSTTTTYYWYPSSGLFQNASSWDTYGPSDPGDADTVTNPPNSSINAEIEVAANVSGTGSADNLFLDAVVTISSGLTTTVANNTVIGKSAVGGVTVSSTWNQAGYLQVGGAFAGTLTVGAGGDVVNTAAEDPDVGENSGATGTLTIQGGGKLTTSATYLTLGVNAGSSGVVTVTGAGSTLTDAGIVIVGDNGAGQLTVSNGGSLFTNGAQGNNYSDSIGWFGSPGVATVTGAGSTWTSANQICVGSGGTLTASDGGDIQSADGLWMVPGGTISVDGTSVIEAGSAGGAALGYLTVDPNSYAGGLGTINGNIIIDANGSVSANDGQGNGDNAALPQTLTINGAVTGQDCGLAIGENLTLALNGAVALTNAGVNFGGWFATLDLGDASAFNAPIYDFMPSDAIDLTNAKFTSSSYTYEWNPSKGQNVLQFTESGVTYDLNVNSPENPFTPGALTLSADASGKGTEITFTSAPTQPFQLWSSLSNFFFTSSGPVNGQDWASSNVTDGGSPIWVETSTPASGYTQGAAETYTISLTSQDWLGTEQPLVTVATDSNFVNPFTSNAAVFGNLAAAAIFSSNSTTETGTGGVLYWQNSATPGDYALEFQPLTTTYVTAPAPTGENTVLNGSPVTMMAAVADPTSWDFASDSTALVLAYTTPGSASGTENIYFQAFNTSGVATSSLVEMASGVADGAYYGVSYNSGTGLFYYS
jgi:T5SS/PEP-CTERM-associated repeat protein